MQEETAYLVRQGEPILNVADIGIAHLVPVNPNPTHSLPTSAEVQKYSAERVRRLRELEASMRDLEVENARKAKAKFTQAGEAAAAKREARARIRAEKAAKGGVELFEPEEPAPTSKPIAKTSLEPLRGTHFHDIAPHPHFPALAHLPSITSLPHPLFPFPSSARDRALLATFTRLLSLDLRVGLGPRFGGEFLVYPGDYLRYHAHYTSQVVVGEEAIRPAEIVAWGRLGTGTKKAGLICCREEEEGGEEDGVEFYSLEWANFG